MSELLKCLEHNYPGIIPPSGAPSDIIIHSVRESQPNVVTKTTIDMLYDDPAWEYLYYKYREGSVFVIVIPTFLYYPSQSPDDWFVIEIHSYNDKITRVVASSCLRFYKLADYLNDNFDKLNSLDDEFMIHLCSSLAQFRISLDYHVYSAVRGPVMVKSANH